MSIDPAELSGVRRGPLHAGERVTLADMRGHRHTLLLEPGRIFHTTKGALAHDDIIGRPQGVVVSTVGGLEFTVFRPLLHEYTVSMPREAAVIYPKDAAQIVLWADVFPGARVLESGVGSGALSLYLLRAIGPTGTLHSYERRDEFAQVALGNVEEFLGGPHPGWTVTVGGLVETGVIRDLAVHGVNLTGGDVTKTSMLVLWMSAIVSAFLDNIPFVATMIPLIQHMGSMGVSNLEPVWWSLALGACLGGNGTIIGASANVIVAGMAAERGVPMTFVRFMMVGFPLMILTILTSTVYVYLRYFM